MTLVSNSSDGELWHAVSCEGFLMEDWQTGNCEGFQMTGEENGTSGAAYNLRVPCSEDLSFLTVYGARCKVDLEHLSRGLRHSIFLL